MTRETYEERKAAHLCVQTVGCAAPVHPGALRCLPHVEKLREASARFRGQEVRPRGAAAVKKVSSRLDENAHRIISLLAEGRSQLFVARALNVGKSTLSLWILNYEAEHGKSVARLGRGNKFQAGQFAPSEDVDNTPVYGRCKRCDQRFYTREDALRARTEGSCQWCQLSAVEVMTIMRSPAGLVAEERARGDGGDQGGEPAVVGDPSGAGVDL